MLCCFLSFLADLVELPQRLLLLLLLLLQLLLLLLLLCAVNDFFVIGVLSCLKGVLLQDKERSDAVAVVAADAEKCCKMRLTDEEMEMRLKCSLDALLVPVADAADAERG